MLKALRALFSAPPSHPGEAWEDLDRRISALEAEKSQRAVREASFMADVSALADKVSNQLRRLAARENDERRKAARNGHGRAEELEVEEFELEEPEGHPPFPQEWRR